MVVQSNRTAEWRQGWPIVFASALGTAAVGLHVYSLGPLIQPIQEDLGWTRQQIVTGITAISFVSIVLQPFAGILIDRVGVRRVALPGLVLYGCCLALLSQSAFDFGTWLLVWVVLGVAYSAIQSVWVTGVAGHFDAARGTALGVALTGTGIGGAIAPIATAILAENFGWRAAYLGLACFPLFIALPVVLAVFTDARFVRKSTSVVVKPTMIQGLSIRDILGSRWFWQLVGASLFMVTGIVGFAVHVVPMLMSAGFASTNAAATAGLLGIGAIIGRLAGGVLLDHIHAGLIGVAALSMPTVAAIVFLVGVSDAGVLSVCVFLVGLSMGAETDCIAYLVGKFFGMKNFGFVFGALCGCFAFGTGIGPLLGGVLYDRFGDYRFFEVSLVVLFALAALLLALLGPYPAIRASEEGTRDKSISTR